MPDNRLLASLPRKSYQDLLPNLAAVTLVFGDVLYESGARIREVYFPGKSVVSLLTIVDGHNALEVGLVGPEGMVGIPLALGIETSPVQALVLPWLAIARGLWGMSHAGGACVMFGR